MSPRLPTLDGPPISFGQADPEHPTPVAAGNRGDGLRRDGDRADGDQPRTEVDRLAQLLALGADGIAAVVWSSADGVPVLARRGRIGPRFRRRPLRSLPAADLPDHSVARLDDLYARLGTSVPLWLEVADPAVLDPIIDRARDHGGRAEENLWLAHGEVDTLTSWRTRTSARLINQADHDSLRGGLERRAAELERNDIDGLCLDHQGWSGGRIALLHRFERLALGSGPTYEREMAALVDAGIDGIRSARVASLSAVMAEYYPTG